MTIFTNSPLFLSGDLSAEVQQIYLSSRRLAIDTETRGLCIKRDRLCLVQLCNEDGETTLLHVYGQKQTPRLQSVLESPHVEKVFHFARYDMATLQHWLGIHVTPIYCTKIASRLARTYTERHGLKDLVRELCDIDLSKEQQSSDWASAQLSPEQLIYAAGDVIHLLAVKEKLEAMLVREGLDTLAHACMACLPTRVALDLAGWEDADIFAHS